MAPHEPNVSLEQLSDYEFLVRFEPNSAQLLMDEPPPVGNGKGPNATAVLSAAIGGCLSASLLFCLRKARLEPRGLRTRASAAVARDEDGHLRVESVEVEIDLGISAEDRARAERCLSLFEDYCVVTQSVRRGIPVQVQVVDGFGHPLFAVGADAG